MKAFTVKQPYADLLAIGAKHYETRSKPTKYRGPVAIHAGVAKGSLKDYGPKDGIYTFRAFQREYAQWAWLRRDGERNFAANVITAMYGTTEGMSYANASYFEFGAIIAYADIVGCYLVEEIKNLTDKERLFGNWTPGRYAWEIAHVLRLSTPIPCKGQLGLWNVPQHIIDEMVRADEARLK